jgi:hypothetical protein
LTGSLAFKLLIAVLIAACRRFESNRNITKWWTSAQGCPCLETGPRSKPGHAAPANQTPLSCHCCVPAVALQHDKMAGCRRIPTVTHGNAIEKFGTWLCNFTNGMHRLNTMHCACESDARPEGQPDTPTCSSSHHVTYRELRIAARSIFHASYPALAHAPGPLATTEDLMH